MPRKTITKDEKLAAALLSLQALRGDPIPHARDLTASQICSLFQYDHAAGFVVHGADNHPAGLTPLLIAEHRLKTAKLDKPAIAKSARLYKAHAEFCARMLAMKEGAPIPEPAKPKTRWPKRKLSGNGAKIRSRPFLKRERGARP